MGLSSMLEFFTMARYRVLIAADQRTYVVSLADELAHAVHRADRVVLPYLGMDVIVVRLAALADHSGAVGVCRAMPGSTIPMGTTCAAQLRRPLHPLGCAVGS